MHVDQAWHHRGLTEIDDPDAGRDSDLTLRADVRDAFAIHDHDLLREHLTAVAVEEAASADGDRARRRGTLQDAALGPHTRLRAGKAPRALRRLAGWSRWSLGVEKHRARQETKASESDCAASHTSSEGGLKTRPTISDPFAADNRGDAEQLPLPACAWVL